MRPNSIRLLPEGLANQIAAGEVVQRPASVLKELMENAIDAGATQVDVIIRDAGKTLLQVIDDGSGMGETDARMCFERHATSKITDQDDLYRIQTMGFRGEAMASIAAVAQVELRTRPEEDELGTLIYIEGSELQNLEPIATPKGTSVAVKNLFFNTPARRKFLKSDRIEFKHIQEWFQYIALANPTIGFSLTHNGKEIFKLNDRKLAKRIVQLFGKSYQKRLLVCREQVQQVNLYGYVGRPEAAKKKRGEQFFFVNNRYIRSSYLHHAVAQAYGQLLNKDEHPFYVLFIEIEPAHIDVNVHPTKTEIKFDDEQSVYAVLLAAIRKALGVHNITSPMDFEADINFGFGENVEQKIANIQPKPLSEDNWKKSGGKASKNAMDNLRHWERLYAEGFEQDNALGHVSEEDYFDFDKLASQLPETEPASTSPPTLVSAVNRENSHEEGKPFEYHEFKGFQVAGGFVLSPLRSGLLLLDQQAAHERVLYERYLRRMEGKENKTSQQLLFAEAHVIERTQIDFFKELLPDFEAMGFGVSLDTAQFSFRLTGVPPEIKDSQAPEILLAMLEDAAQNRKTELRRDALARRIAKRAAKRPHERLSPEEAEELINQLFSCELPQYTPGGKTTYKIVEAEQLRDWLEKN